MTSQSQVSSCTKGGRREEGGERREEGGGRREEEGEDHDGDEKGKRLA